MAADDKAKLLGAFDDVVGIFANYFQVIATVIDFIYSAVLKDVRSSLERDVLMALGEGVEDLLNLAGATDAEVKMSDLRGYATDVRADEEILVTEGPRGAHVNAATFFKDALKLIDACEDDFYWYRPLVLTRAAAPAAVPDEIIEGRLVGGWWRGAAWYDTAIGIPPPPVGANVYHVVPPTDTAHVPGFATVLDPQLALTAFLSATKNFLVITQQLDPAGFPQFLDPSAPNNYNWKVREIANHLQSFYDGSVSARPGGTFRTDTLVSGLVSSRIPTSEEVYNLGWNVTFASPTRTADPNPIVTPSWNGIYGVIDSHAVYVHSVGAPSSGPSHEVAAFPTENISTLVDEPRNSYTYQHDIYPWVLDRVTVGIIARWKAVYLRQGYDKAWSILQHLRILTGEQTRELTDTRRDWSARFLFEALPGLPRADSDIAEMRLSILVERLRQISVAGWNNPPDDTPRTLDYTDGFGRPWGWDKRPVGLRSLLGLAASI